MKTRSLCAFRVAASFCSVAALSLFISGAAIPKAAAGGLHAYTDPTDGAVPVTRAVRVDSDEVRKLAFPSARGFGRFADPDIGPGQSFKVYKVKNLNDSGPGSFRECYIGNGPRVCIFEVSGTITMLTDTLARVLQSNLYIAGQTSPGGVQIKVGPTATAGPLRSVATSDLIVRYMKLRPGTAHLPSTNVKGVALGTEKDRPAHDIIIDHVSQQWATDEGITMIGVDRATLQWSLQSEPIACGACRDDHHPAHDYGMFLTANNRFTLFKNVLMGGRLRNPNIAANSLDMINNVAYNYGEYAAQFYVNTTVSIRANVIGNWYSRGPRTGVMYETGQRPHCLFAAFDGTTSPGLGFEFYLNKNICPHDLTGNNNLKIVRGQLQSPILYQKGTLKKPNGTAGVLFETPRHGGLSVGPGDMVSATQAVADVIAFAGAMQDMHKTRRRDSVDSRAIGQLRNCDDRAYVPQPTVLTAVPSSGYPNLAARATWSWTNDDKDNDGMLDSWELGFPGITSLTQLKSNGDYDRDGWSDLEEFLNYLAGEGVQRTGRGSLANVPTVYCGYSAP